MQPSILFHMQAEFVDVENITNERVRTLDFVLEINFVTSKPASQNLSSETYDSNPEVIVTQTNYSNEKSEPHFQKYCKNSPKFNHSVSIFFSQETRRNKRFFFSWSKSPLNSFSQNFKSNKN